MISNSKSEPSRDRKNGQPVAQKSEFAVNICLTHELRLRPTDISFPPTGSVLENFNDVCKRFRRRMTLIAWGYPDAANLLIYLLWRRIQAFQLLSCSRIRRWHYVSDQLELVYSYKRRRDTLLYPNFFASRWIHGRQRPAVGFRCFPLRFSSLLHAIPPELYLKVWQTTEQKLPGSAISRALARTDVSE